jgi:hypothetical protein
MSNATSKKEKSAGWARSGFTTDDMRKFKKAGMLSKAMEIAIPGDEVVPRPNISFWVLFFSFLYRGLSLPVHEFLCGLLFVYGVQLHQLMPNSILHIACFITLCKVSLAWIPIGAL